MEAQIIQQPLPADVEKNKVMAILAYFIFFIPLLVAKDSPFAKFHANQGLLIFLLSIASIVALFIPFIGIFLSIAGYIAVLVFTVLGIIAAAKGQNTPVPYIGKYELIK